MIISNENNREKIELVRNKNYVTWRDCFRAENSVTADDTSSLMFCCSILMLLARWLFGAACRRERARSTSSVLCFSIFYLPILFPISMLRTNYEKWRSKLFNTSRNVSIFRKSHSAPPHRAIHKFFSVSIGHRTPSRPFFFRFDFWRCIAKHRTKWNSTNCRPVVTLVRWNVRSDVECRDKKLLANDNDNNVGCVLITIKYLW